MTLTPDHHAAPTGIDEALSRLTAAAERGEDCPAVSLISGGWLFQGGPISTMSYYDRTWRALCHELNATSDARRLRGTPVEREAVISTAATNHMAALGVPEPSGATVLSLANVSAYPPGAPSIHMPTARLQLSAVSAWWINSFSTDEARQGASGYALGLGFDF